MAVIINGGVWVNGMWVGSASQLKNEVKDGTVIDVDYKRPNRITL